MSVATREWIYLALALALFAWASFAVGSRELDLPVERPEPRVPAPPPGAPPAPPKPPEPPPPEQRDEKTPTLYGCELRSESSSVVYVLDISGSMSEDWKQDGGNRLDRAKVALEESIRSLPSSWRFSLLAFDCDTRWWSTVLVPAGETEKSRAIAWARALEPVGGTGTSAATCAGLAVDRANKLVVLVTDGAPSCGQDAEAHRRVIAAGNAQKAVINVFAIGCPTGSAMAAFCRDVARDASGVVIDVR